MLELMTAIAKNDEATMRTILERLPSESLTDLAKSFRLLAEGIEEIRDAR